MDACCGGDDDGCVSGGDGGDAARDVGRAGEAWWRDRALALPAASGLLLAAGYGAHLAGSEGTARSIWAVGLAAGGWTFVPGALRRLLRGRLGVGLLMTIAAAGAVALGAVGEAAALAFLFSLAETLEDRAMDSAKGKLRALLALLPATARVRRGGADMTVPAEQVRVGDILVVGAGDRIATDGTVTDGRSSLDVSSVTGESIPVAVGPGDPVAAGVINGAGTLTVRAGADGRDNSLTRVVALVEQAHARKGRRARMADRIAAPLVPAVLAVAAVIAAGGSLWGDPAVWIERALVVLVAASPCALAIAVPVTVISAIGSASRLGVVIKSGAAFEQFGTVTTVAFDKTGTLTEGRPAVVAMRAAGGFTDAGVLAAATAVEAASSHPLASAITTAAPHVASASRVVEHAGYGAEGVVDGRTVRVGSTAFVDVGDMSAAVDDLAVQGMTVVAAEIDGSVAGVIGVRDELRGEAAAAVAGLRAMGMDVVMVTGDNQRTATALARQAGIADVFAEQLPADKAATIEYLARSVPVAMVGDGINDAPALATATVGIAIGTGGAAAAIEAADIALTGRNLRLIPVAIAHARRGRRIMTVNIALSIAIIAALFPLALTGVLGLASVVLIHECAEVVVIANGLRAARRPRWDSTPVTTPAISLGTPALYSASRPA